MVVRAPVPHHPDGLDRQQHRERLPDLIVQAGRADLRDVDRVHAAEEIQTLAGHRTEHADREPGAGKRMPPDDLLRQPELPPHLPHLVLEELPERLDQFPREVGPQPANVVMGLDRDRRPTARRR